MTPATKPFRIAIVGTGRISKFHFAAWHANPGTEIVAVCDVDAARARAAAEKYGVKASYSSLADLLDKETVDALDIASPPESHFEVLKTAAGRGVPCLCQKPLARDFDEASRIVAEIAPKIRLMVNENRRHLPYFRKARQWIADGLLGEIRQVTWTAFRSSFLPRADGTYTGTPALVKGPRLYIGETMIHQIDALTSLIGPMRALASRSRRTEKALEGETLCTLLLESAAGAPIVIAGNNVAFGYPKEFNDRFEIHGSRASLTWDGETLRLLGPQPIEERFETRAKYDEMYQSCFTVAAADFREALQSGRAFSTEATENLMTLKIVEDAYRLAG